MQATRKEEPTVAHNRRQVFDESRFEDWAVNQAVQHTKGCLIWAGFGGATRTCIQFSEVGADIAARTL